MYQSYFIYIHHTQNHEEKADHTVDGKINESHYDNSALSLCVCARLVHKVPSSNWYNDRMYQNRLTWFVPCYIK